MRPHAGTIPLGHAPGTRPRRERIEASIIVPLYDEASVLPHCLERLQRIGEQLAVPCEFLFVDDGSRHDGRAGPGARDAVVIPDADLQDPPELMPRVVSAWREGVDVELMRRRTRAGKSLGKRISAHPFYRALNRTSDFDIPAEAGHFRLLGRRAVDALPQLPERNRGMKGLLPGSAWRPG